MPSGIYFCVARVLLLSGVLIIHYEIFKVIASDGTKVVCARQKGRVGDMATSIWEHLICDEADYRAHMDYVHINPLKHGAGNAGL
jgi:putative transposase